MASTSKTKKKRGRPPKITLNIRAKRRGRSTKSVMAYIERRATRLSQGGDYAVYQFALSGEELLQIADISRIARKNTGKLLGYQRGEVTKHIAEITEYLNKDKVLFPHAIIVAFNSLVEFIQQRGPGSNDGVSVAGILRMPVPKEGAKKPGWIVDGQQRTIATSRSKRPDMSLPICAFITDNVETQREQFIRINNSKPLPKGLVEELLPEVSVSISGKLAPSKIPSSMINHLNQDKTSPFFQLIARSSASVEERKLAVIKDGPLLRVIKDSLNQPSGCLYPYQNIATRETDTDAIWQILIIFWTAVKNVFPDAWGRPPQNSRLMHGAGLTAMGRLMDRIMPHIEHDKNTAIKQAEKQLSYIKPHCHWTSGNWEELGNLKWNEIQNLSRHVKALSNHLIRKYLQEKAKR